ncbi:MAG: hypothetical protein MK212_10140 [Saprospiraceae bacterium]|nr:hypothetical protein [Saprospiraceae bacterium]
MIKFLTMFAVIFAAFTIAFLLINIRQIIVGKDFRGTCAQNNPMLKSQLGDCTVCGKKADEACKMPEVH